MRPLFAFLLIAVAARPAAAKVYKLDGYPAAQDAFSAALMGGRVSSEAGFAAHEAYGVLLTPDPGDYPFHITAIQFFQKTICDASGGTCADDTTNNVTLQVWLEDGYAAAPARATPDFQIASTDYIDPVSGNANVPVMGDTYMSYEFNPDDREGVPPIVTTPGTVIRVAIQFDDEWGDFSSVNPSCALIPGVQGCQSPAAVRDASPQVRMRNVVHLADGSWAFSESLGITSNWVLRIVTDTPDDVTPPMPDAGVPPPDAPTGSESEAESESESESEAEAEAESEGAHGDNCSTDRDCMGGQRCDQGTCVAGTCAADTDCAGGQYCATDHVCRGLCSTDRDCRGGEMCQGGARCVAVASAGGGGCGCTLGDFPGARPVPVLVGVVLVASRFRGRSR